MKKGFTLIELLIVIAILAILATAVVLVLNPAELLKQGRDSTRLSDMASLNSAIALYMADVPVVDLGTCLTTSSRVTANTAGVTSSFINASGSVWVATTTVTGTGWVDINLGLLTSGAPLSKLPVDPVNSTTTSNLTSYYYGYSCRDSISPYTYELNANMESGKYSSAGPGTGDVESNSKDGGDNNNWYEIGNSLTL